LSGPSGEGRFRLQRKVCDGWRVAGVVRARDSKYAHGQEDEDERVLSSEYAKEDESGFMSVPRTPCGLRPRRSSSSPRSQGLSPDHETSSTSRRSLSDLRRSGGTEWSVSCVIGGSRLGVAGV
jgi:hypothetical protein